MTEANDKRFHLQAIKHLLVIGFCFLLNAGATFASTAAEDLALCEKEMVEKHAATSVRDLERVHHEDVPYVYGNADFSDIKGLHFRCQIYHGKVRKVRYLVKDPEFVNGRAWAKDRPHGQEHEGLQLDAAATAPPPADPPSPHFVRVPQQP